MNLKNAALLLCEDLTTVKVRVGAGTKDNDIREPDFSGKQQNSRNLYTYLVTRDLASTLKRGDKVSVQGRNLGSLSYATVEYVDQEADIQVDSDLEYKWVFCKVPLDQVDFYEQRVESLYYRIAEKQRSSAKQQLLNALGLTGSELLTLGNPPVKEKTAEELAAEKERAIDKF